MTKQPRTGALEATQQRCYMYFAKLHMSAIEALAMLRHTRNARSQIIIEAKMGAKCCRSRYAA